MRNLFLSAAVVAITTACSVGFSQEKPATDTPPATAAELSLEALVEAKTAVETAQAACSDADVLPEATAAEKKVRAKAVSKAKRDLDAAKVALTKALKAAMSTVTDPTERAGIVVTYLGGFPSGQVAKWFAPPAAGAAAFKNVPGFTAFPANTVKSGQVLGLGRVNPGSQTSILGALGNIGVAATPGEWSGLAIQNIQGVTPTVVFVPWTSEGFGAPVLVNGPYVDGGYSYAADGAGLILFSAQAPMKDSINDKYSRVTRR
jgi:hypothetical protein